MKFDVLLLAICIGSPVHAANNSGRIDIRTDGSKILSISPAKNSGIDFLYIVDNPHGLSIQYSHEGSSNPIWIKFDEQGTAFGTLLTSAINVNNKSVLNDPDCNAGYSIIDGDNSINLWIINYSDFRFICDSLSISTQSDCNNTIINFSGLASPIHYYGPSGRRFVASRDIELEYSNLSWDEQNKSYNLHLINDTLEYINDKFYISPPLLTTTDIFLKGDRFESYFNESLSTVIKDVQPHAVSIKTDVLTEEVEGANSNQFHQNQKGLGGNAPFTAVFKATVTPGVIYKEWQIAKDDIFNDIIYRNYENETEYTFTSSGNYFVRFLGSNEDGSCEELSEVYNVSIGESRLVVPNAFTPNNDNINDEWKVAYQSLIEFKCWIFDRTGKEIFYFDNPSNGWDGKSNGNQIQSGVYFYVIKALGSDGKKYNLSGDINIISSRQSLNNIKH